MSFNKKKNFSGNKKSAGGNKKGGQSKNTKNNKSKKKIPDPNGINICYFQGELKDCNYSNNGTPFWRGRLEVIDVNNPKFVAPVFLKAFNDVARELKDAEEGDILYVETMYKVEKVNGGYWNNFVVEDFFEPEDLEDLQDGDDD